MKKNIVGKIITIICIICATIEVGIALGYFMLSNIDFNKYKTSYIVEIVR